MQTHIFVFHHHALRLRQRVRDVNLLRHILRRRRQPQPQFVDRAAVGGDGQTVGRTHVDARIALDAQRRREVRLDVAVEAARDLVRRLFRRETQFHFDIDVAEALDQFFMLHLGALRRVVVVRVRPAVHTHLRTHERHADRRTLVNRAAVTMRVDGNRRLVSMRDGPDDVLRSPRRIATEEHRGVAALMRCLADDRHALRVEGDARVGFDPRKCVVLADRQDHRVAREDDGLEHAA